MSTKYVLNQFGKLSKSQHIYATKKFNKYTKNIQLNPNIRNSLIIPVSSKIKMPIFQKDKLLKSLSKKKQIKYIIKQQLQSHKDILQSNRNKILKSIKTIQPLKPKREIRYGNFAQLLRLFGGSKKIKNKK